MPELRTGELQGYIHAWARSKGWWTGEHDSVPSKLLLVHSEVSEATEEFRKHPDDLRFQWYQPDGKPEGFGVELADTVIRLFDLAERCGLDLGELIAEKMLYNLTRPHRHGGKAI